MSGALLLGPLAIPAPLLVLVAAVVVSLGVGRWLGRRAGVDVESLLWWSLIVGLVTARLIFVWEFRSAYLASARDALGILDIRDGGWNPTAGMAGAWLFVLSRSALPRAVQRPLRWALATGCVLWLAGSVALTVSTASDRRLPALALTTLDGTPAMLDGFTGRPTVVNLWATWCGPCVREMPVLHQAQRDHPGTHFVFVNQGESPERVNAWLKGQGLTLQNVLIDAKGRAGAEFGQRALPTTLFFDARGQWVAMRVGELSRATLTEKLQAASR